MQQCALARLAVLSRKPRETSTPWAAPDAVSSGRRSAFGAGTVETVETVGGFVIWGLHRSTAPRVPRVSRPAKGVAGNQTWQLCAGD